MTDDNNITAEELADYEEAMWIIADHLLADLGPPTTQLTPYGPTDKYLTRKSREALANGFDIKPIMLIYMWEAAWYFPPEHRGQMSMEDAMVGAMQVRNMDPDRPTYPRRVLK